MSDESAEATSELLGDEAERERVRRAEVEVARGDVLDEDDVRSLLAQGHRSGETAGPGHEAGFTAPCAPPRAGRPPSTAV
jgi:hypothetical protein